MANSRAVSSATAAVVATRPGISGSGLFHVGGEPSGRVIHPPDASMRAAPAATSHSCFGTRVQVSNWGEIRDWLIPSCAVQPRTVPGQSFFDQVSSNPEDGTRTLGVAAPSPYGFGV